MADIRRAAPNNIYTVLAFIATAILAFGVGYVLWRYNTVFGGLPFTAKSGTAMLEAARAMYLA